VVALFKKRRKRILAKFQGAPGEHCALSLVVATPVLDYHMAVQHAALAAADVGATGGDDVAEALERGVP
jgi:hypothetical protein